MGEGEDGVCKTLCQEGHKCHLSDDFDGKFYTRDVSCTMKCAGFNMHGDDRCTLFGEDVKLRKSGHTGNQYYAMPGFEDPTAKKEEDEEEEPPKKEEDEPEKEDEEKKED